MNTSDLIALHQHLARPDGPDLIGRGHHVTQPGDARRFALVYLPLVKRWAITHQASKDRVRFIGKAKVAKGFRLVIADRRRRA